MVGSDESGRSTSNEAWSLEHTKALLIEVDRL